MSQQKSGSNALVNIYTERITEPSTGDEVYGYWLFVIGVIASFVGVALFLFSATLERPASVADPATYWTARQAGVVLAAGGVALLLGGVAVRLPLRRTATLLSYLGVFVCLVALVWFISVYPGNWNLQSGNPGVIGLYTVGLAIIAVGSIFVPMLSRAETETASERAAREESERAAEETRSELQTLRQEREEAQAAADAAAAELEALKQSKARFEIYQDRGGGHRWRLRHYNGNIIADSGEGYSSRQKCQQGMHSVMRNALGSEVRLIEPDDPAEVESETETEPIDPIPESQASFEIYEDDAGEYRWRLVHDNGNIIADSGEGYASKSNARRAMDRVRDHATTASYLRIDPVGYELYRDSAGEYRWRLVHKNGNILADSGQGYSSRQKARQGIDSVRNNSGDAPIVEL